MIELRLPQLSISMEEGLVLSWLVEDGAEVAAGQPLVEIETDKATLEVEAPAAGVLEIVAEPGTSVPVDGLLAEIQAVGAAAAPARAPAAPDEGSRGVLPARGFSGQAAVHDRAPGRPIASPAARRLASERGVDLAAVAGSGPGGRIVFRDVAGAEAGAASAAAPEAAPVVGLRELVVDGIVRSWRDIPHIHIAGELAADGLAEARRVLSARGDAASVTDLLILAVAGALLDVPDLNAVLRPDGAVVHSARVHLGLAVATGAGVVAPVVRDADSIGLAEISRERARLVDAARTGRLDKRDLGGATCTLSNLGAYPVDFFAPVVSGPQVALVAVGRLAEKPVAIDGMLAVRHRIWVNAAIDHRGADGEAGGRFLAALENRLAELPAVVQRGERR